MGMSSSIGIGYPAGSRKYLAPDETKYDEETTPRELADAGIRGAFTYEWNDPMVQKL